MDREVCRQTDKQKAVSGWIDRNMCWWIDVKLLNWLIVGQVNGWMDRWMRLLPGGRRGVWVCDLNTALYSAYLQFCSSYGPIVEVPLSPPPSLRPQCSVSLSLSACSSSSLQQWPSACRKCDISVAQPAEYGQRTNLYCPVTHLELVSFLHKEPLFTAYDYSLLHWKKWPHYLWSSINTVCVL